MDIEDIPTIREILADYIDVDDRFYRDMIAQLEERENRMVTEIGPRIRRIKDADQG
jgi:hypothetical protein